MASELQWPVVGGRWSAVSRPASGSCHPVSCLLPTVYWARRGFTLVELLVVMGILMILFNLLMVPMMMGLSLTSSTRQAVASQDASRMALEQMRRDFAKAMFVLPGAPWETTSLLGSPSATSSAALPAAETTQMTVTDASKFPASGIVLVGLEPFDPDEYISYSSRTATTLDGLTRGVNGTTAVDHKVISRVLLVSPSTTLTADLAAAETSTMSVGDASGFPAAGVVAIEGEHIAYTSRTGSTLDGLTRGASGTTAAVHLAGSRVLLASAPARDEFTTSRVDLIMPKTDASGNPLQPLTPDPEMVRYYVAPVRKDLNPPEGWPKYWNPSPLPPVGVSPARGMEPCLYVLYRARFNLQSVQSDPAYTLYGSDPWRPDFYDDPRPSPVVTQPASYSFWWRRMSMAMTPVESADAALYVRISPYEAQQRKGMPLTGSTRAELRPMEEQLPSGEWVAAPGFAAVATQREREQLVPNDRDNPTKYFSSMHLWSDWPTPVINLSNGNPPAGGEFWTVNFANGSLDFAASRTEYFDGDGALVKSSPPQPSDTIPADCDLLQVANNVYEVQFKKDDGTAAVAGLDRGGPTYVIADATHSVGDPISDFVLIPGSEKVQVVDSSGNIFDYARGSESDPTLIGENSYYIDYESGRITFAQGFNDPLAGPTKDVILQFQYRRNVLRQQNATTGVLEKAAGGSDDTVLGSYSSLATINVRLTIASYSRGRNPSDEFRLASRLEVGNAPR